MRYRGGAFVCVAFATASLDGASQNDYYCASVSPQHTPFCGIAYRSHVTDAPATDDAARREYERFAPLNAEPSCQDIYKEFLCAASFPACVDRGDGRLRTIVVCRESCVYSALCGFPAYRNTRCAGLNSVHKLSYMMRQPLASPASEDGSAATEDGSLLVSCLSASGGTYSAHHMDGPRYRLNRQWPQRYHDWGPHMPTLAQFVNLLAAPGRHTFGMLGVDNFGHGDRLFLDFVLAKHQEFQHAIEFGTYRGETSLFLGMAMRTRGGTLLTYDIGDYRRPEVKRGWLDNMRFEVQDLLGGDGAYGAGGTGGAGGADETGRAGAGGFDAQGANTRAVAALADARTAPKLLLVDNGDKYREAKLYVHHLPAGSGFVIHDWDQEVSAHAILPLAAAAGFEQRYEELAADVLHCHLRFFLRVSSLSLELPPDGRVRNVTFGAFENGTVRAEVFCDRHGLDRAGGECAQVRAAVQTEQARLRSAAAAAAAASATAFPVAADPTSN
eukprot:g5290.t1